MKLRALRKPLAWIACIAVLVLVGMYLTGVFDERIAPDSSGSSDAHSQPPPAGDVFVVQRVEQDVIERSPGTVRAIRETVVTSRIVAEVREILARAGSRVERDDILVLLDDRDLQALLQQTEQELSGAEARSSEAVAAHARMTAAAEKNAIALSALDQSEAVMLSAASEVERLGQRVEQARVDLSHATIRAPFDAVITDRYAYPGDLASPERPLVRLYDPERMRLEAYVRESLAIHLEVGERVTVLLETLDAEIDGSVEEVVPQAESASRSFLVKVGLPTTKNLYPGMFGRLLLRSGKAERLVVPDRALTRIGQLTYVTLADGHGTRRLVVPGRSMGDGRTEIYSGVEEGLEIVVPR